MTAPGVDASRIAIDERAVFATPHDFGWLKCP